MPASNQATYKTTNLAAVSFTLPDYYTELEPIGSGSYGHVWKARDARTGDVVAIKKVDWKHRQIHGVDYWKKVLREIRLMRHFDRHDCLLSLTDLVMPTTAQFDALYLVSVFIKTDLNTLLDRCPSHFNAENSFSILYSMMSGLFAVHSAGVMHRDLKPSNILVDSDGTVKLADFGLGRDVPEEDEELTNYVVTRWYRAPEILFQQERYTEVVDVWSLGCIFAEFLAAGAKQSRSSQPLFPSRAQGGEGTKEQIKLVLNFVGHPADMSHIEWVSSKRAKEWLRRQPPREPVPLATLFPHASEDALDFLSSTLVWNPANRPTVRQCLRHPYFKEYAWSEGNEDEPWPKFDGSFSKKIKSEEDARKLASLEVCRFHPEYKRLPGVQIMQDVPVCTATRDSVRKEEYEATLPDQT